MSLDNYETVKTRKKRFYEGHPDGRIIPEPIEVTKDLAIFKAYVYKNKDDQEKHLPWATGHALELKGSGGANNDAWTENCEESAIGRALDNAGYATTCSKEEMSKVERKHASGNNAGETVTANTASQSDQERVTHAGGHTSSPQCLKHKINMIPSKFETGPRFWCKKCSDEKKAAKSQDMGDFK